MYVCKSTYFEHLQLAGHGGTYTYNSDPYHYRVRSRATGELIVEPGFRTRTLKKSEVRTHACIAYYSSSEPRICTYIQTSTLNKRAPITCNLEKF